MNFLISTYYMHAGTQTYTYVYVYVYMYTVIITFFFDVVFVTTICTRQVFAKSAPKARENPRTRRKPLA